MPERGFSQASPTRTAGRRPRTPRPQVTAPGVRGRGKTGERVSRLALTGSVGLAYCPGIPHPLHSACGEVEHAVRREQASPPRRCS